MPTTELMLPEGFTLREVGGRRVAVPDRSWLNDPQPMQRDVQVKLLRSGDDTRAAGAPDSKPAANEIDILGSVEVVDSYGTLFIQRGMMSDEYKLNPVFLRQHRADELPLGAADRWWATETKVRKPGSRKREPVPATAFRIRFDVAEDPDDDEPGMELARRFLGAYRRKMLRAASIRFEPIQGHVLFGDDMTEDERNTFGIGQYGIVFRKWKLCELSAVTLPGNAYALQMRTGRPEVERLAARVAELERQLTESVSSRPSEVSAPGDDPAEARASDSRAESPSDDEETLRALRRIRVAMG